MTPTTNELTVVINERPVQDWNEEKPDAAHMMAYRFLKSRSGKIIKDYVLSAEDYILN